MERIVWFCERVKANYELKPEDYDFYTQGGVVRVYHRAAFALAPQYVGYVPNKEEVTR